MTYATTKRQVEQAGRQLEQARGRMQVATEALEAMGITTAAKAVAAQQLADDLADTTEATAKEMLDELEQKWAARIVLIDWAEKAAAKRRTYEETHRMLLAELGAADDAEHDTAYAHAVVIDLAASVQQRVGQRVSDIVSSCLAAVFDDPFTLHIEFIRKRNTTEAEVTLRRDGHTVHPTKASSGGVRDIAAFALRVACLALQRPPVRRTVVLDEPFPGVSVRYQGAVADMMLQLADELDFQFIMVTHVDQLVGGSVVQF